MRQTRQVVRDDFPRGRSAGRKAGHPDPFPPGESTVSGLVERNRFLEAQLLHLQRMESFYRLLPGVVHDFNHLLTHIIGYTELTLSGLEPEDRHTENLTRVRDAGRKASDLTRTLLSHCRQQDRKPEPLDLSVVVENVGRLFQRMLGEQIQVDLDLAGFAGPVMADPVQMEQVLMNLVVNARDALNGNGRIVFRTRTASLAQGNRLGLPPGRYAVVSVEDSGQGIPPGLRERIFDPFFTTKAAGQGTGLGLSTVNSIVQQSNGHIVLKSRPGRGTCFTIYLPVIEEVDQADPEEAPGSMRARTSEEPCPVLINPERSPGHRGYDRTLPGSFARGR